jgi:acetolactate decarboxylase
MIAIDGEFFRADVDGNVTPVGPEERTPFAVVTSFEPTVEERLGDEEIAHEVLLEHLDELVPAAASSCAIRLDGRFDLVRARSVPRQEPPYRPLTEVVADQHVFELRDVKGTMLGFRFPAYAEGIEVAGYHLHFISVDRSRGGHVLNSRSRGLHVRLDPSDDLHVELPPAVDLADPDLAAATHEAIASSRPRPTPPSSWSSAAASSADTRASSRCGLLRGTRAAALRRCGWGRWGRG